MANHVSHAALPYPIKGARFTVPITYLDADGDPTDPTTPDTEVSIDGAAFADCAEEVTTITGSNGAGYITLSGAETNGSLVVLAAKVASGPKATLATLIPRVLPSVSTGTAQAGGATSITLQAGSNALHSTAFRGMFVKTTGGTGGGGTGGANNQVRRITDYNTGTLACTVSPAWETNPDSTTTYEILAPEGTGIPKSDVIAFASTAGTFSGGRPEVNATHWAGTAMATPDTAGYPKVTIKSGSGTGEISLSSGGVSLTSSERAAVADAVFDEDITTHRTANSAGAMFQPLHSGACQAGGSTTTVVLASGASSSDDYYNGDLLVGWVTADGTNKFADYISDYVGSTRTATVTGIPVSPGATYSYVVLPGGTIPGASAPSASDNAAAVWNALTASYTAAGSFGERFTVVRRNTLGATGTSSALTLDSGASTTADYYRYATIQMLSGACAGQSRQITAYSTGRVATVDPAFTGTPASGDAFLILPLGIDATTVATIVAGVWSALRADYNSAGTFGEYTNADVLRIAGNTTSAGNLNNALNGTGYTFANCTVPAVTTVTTLTGHTPQTGDTYARLGAPAGASVSADIAAVVADTNELQTDWANGGRLDVILDARASQTTADAILADTGTDGVVVASHTTEAKAEINAEVSDVLTVDTFAQPGTVPAATSSLKDKINWIFTVLRNKITQTATTQTLRNDADTTTIGTSTHSDNGTTHTRGKWS